MFFKCFTLGLYSDRFSFGLVFERLLLWFGTWPFSVWRRIIPTWVALPYGFCTLCTLFMTLRSFICPASVFSCTSGRSVVCTAQICWADLFIINKSYLGSGGFFFHCSISCAERSSFTIKSFEKEPGKFFRCCLAFFAKCSTFSIKRF